ncbi:hypothetical protein BV25DRAFT_1897304 [Artomyces pyxidatus]|uniref:Uncharacterized protein n=1 Tax=Artomyces pyxidatus TaxID=48021 RepID=A0ACB8TF86_9AGAM|nr:hypothetical protein BV25DRAFT_1897304 [Artomyces pyxidatus]
MSSLLSMKSKVDGPTFADNKRNRPSPAVLRAVLLFDAESREAIDSRESHQGWFDEQQCGSTHPEQCDGIFGETLVELRRWYLNHEHDVLIMTLDPFREDTLVNLCDHCIERFWESGEPEHRRDLWNSLPGFHCSVWGSEYGWKELVLGIPPLQMT